MPEQPSTSAAATEPLIPAWSYTRLGWVRIYLRCPDHGPFCDGSDCCCRDLHWRPWALLKCGRWRALKGRMFPPAPRRRRA